MWYIDCRARRVPAQPSFSITNCASSHTRGGHRSDAHPNGNADFYAYGYLNANGDLYTHANADSNVDAHADSHIDANINPYADALEDVYTLNDAFTNTFRDINAIGDANAGRHNPHHHCRRRRHY